MTTDATPLDGVLALLAAGYDRTVAELTAFAAIPSVSTDPAHAADVQRAADWVAAALAAAGPFAVRTLSTRGNPAELAQHHLGLDTVFFSFSTADEDYHAPNEFFRLHRLREGMEAWARCWALLGEERA